ncbi:hypothetical protein EDB83DRAFT_2325245 [Lactarius deliciosus]|nr:hypothetical protein EDB83DRAFT_2325245 [Lactarius deliciosus]
MPATLLLPPATIVVVMVDVDRVGSTGLLSSYGWPLAGATAIIIYQGRGCSHSGMVDGKQLTEYDAKLPTPGDCQFCICGLARRLPSHTTSTCNHLQQYHQQQQQDSATNDNDAMTTMERCPDGNGAMPIDHDHRSNTCRPQQLEMSTSDTREYEYSLEFSEERLVLDSYSSVQYLFEPQVLTSLYCLHCPPHCCFPLSLSRTSVVAALPLLLSEVGVVADRCCRGLLLSWAIVVMGCRWPLTGAVIVQAYTKVVVMDPWSWYVVDGQQQDGASNNDDAMTTTE